MSAMTDDIVERLRSVNACAQGCNGRCDGCPDNIIQEAAAALLSARADIARLTRLVGDENALRLGQREIKHSLVEELNTVHAEIDRLTREKGDADTRTIKLETKAWGIEVERDAFRADLEKARQREIKVRWEDAPHEHRRPKRADFEGKTIKKFRRSGDNVWRFWFTDGTSFAIQSELFSGLACMEICEVCIK